MFHGKLLDSGEPVWLATSIIARIRGGGGTVRGMLMKKVTNEEIRREYLRRVAGIPALNSQWIASGVPLIERARRSWRIRHDARVEVRALMLDPVDVEALRRRDLKKYGNPDGPSFVQLVERYVAEGKTEDQAYEEIIGSSVRTNAATNTRMGLQQ